MLDRIQWFGHASFCVQGAPLIYIDPVGIRRSAFLADLILVSQAQYDHCSQADIAKLRGPNTQIIGSHDAAAALDDPVVEVLRPWQSATVGRARITALPAQTHTRSAFEADGSGLGFLIALDYYDIYYAGAAVTVPEQLTIQPDIAILPVRDPRSGLLNIDGVIAAVEALQPRWVIPSHWSSDSGGQFDVKTLREALGSRADLFVPGEVALSS